MLGSQIAGRYRLDTELGRGGMGVVYRAHDTVLKRDVAVKLLSVTGLGTEGRARLMNEAQAVARLNHPNIVAVYDAGEIHSDRGDLIPFVVMELLDGPTLHEQRPESLDQTLTITRQLCAALEHAHEHGIVHRDLKPENVMLSPPPRPSPSMGEGTREGVIVKLMDFGLARSLTSRMTSEGTFMGTLFYMAPEVALGSELDGRTDLYALGVMLYELTTGRLPFEADDPVAVLSQHLNAPVVPPLAHNPELPPALDRLIVDLMAKEPNRRPASAAAVADILDDLGRKTTEARRPLSTLDRIVRGRLVGRQQELAQARAVWSQAMAGQGQVLLISGEPGIGKTRLVNELVTQARVSGGQALTGASYAEGGSPYAPFRQILGQGLRDSPSGDGIELSEDVLADLLTLAPEFRSHYPELPERTPGDPLEEQQRLLESVGLYFNMLSNRAPLLLVLEDSHWADSGTISLMRHLARSCTRQPLMIALTYREVEIDEARTLHQALLDLQRERLAIRMKLSRLDREGTQALMATLFDEEITPDFLEGFYRESEGNPFFIEEIAKALVESGQLTFKDGRWHRPAIEELGIPQSIRVAVQARVSALSESSRIVLEQAAVLGRVFDLSTLELATELVEDSLIEALEEALAAQLIKEEPGEVPGAGELFSFVHALIPSSLVAGMRALRRRRLQRRAATALEEVHPDDYEVLAHHFIEAGQIDKGTGYLLQAGDQARAQYAHEEAIDSYRGAIDYLKEEGQLEQAAQTMMKLGLAYNNAFEFTQSRQAYEEGFALWQQASLSPAVESSRPSPHPLRLRIGEPDLLDPGFTNNWANGVFLDQLFSGLLQLTVEMDIIPDVAHSWQTLEGGRRYRFHLRDDVFWSDGIPVTAGDFAFAWKRMLSPGSGSVNASSLFTIKNGRDYHEGRLVSWDEVGVEIVDDLTLELTLENPDSTFLYLLCNMFAFAVPQHRLQEPDTHWMAWDEMVTNGPFRLAEWEPGQRLLLTANPGYHGRRSGNLESVEIIVPGSEGDEGRLALYEGDRLDVVLPAMAHAVQARNRFAGDHVSTPWLSSSYIGFNTTRAPFDDPRVRRALALATDRERLSDIFWQGGSFPASGGLVPPGMPGHVAGIAPPFDPEAAHRLLAEAGYGEKSTFPPQRFVTGPRYTMKKAYEYLAGQWYELLHIEIEVASLPRETYFERLLQGDPPAIFDGAWIADYPDPDNFLRLGSFRNYTGWRHEAYERLLHQARGMMDQEGRMVLYRQAQEILVEEAPIIPLFYARLTLLIKPWVRRFPTSPLKWSHWKDVVIEPH